MLKQTVIGSFFLLHVFLGGYAYSQPAPQMPPDKGAAETEPNPEPPKKVLDVIIKDNLLTVDLENADFGEVLNAIAKDSGFKVEISGDVSGKKLTTKFIDMDIERGIERLLSLIREKNYFFHYDTKGMLTKVEVYGGASLAPVASGPKTTAKPQVQRPPVPRPSPPAVPPGSRMPATSSASPSASRPPAASSAQPSASPPSPRGITRRPYVAPRPAPQTVPAPQEEPAPVPDIEGNDEPPVGVEEVPYIPPQKQPVYIPPKRH